MARGGNEQMMYTCDMEAAGPFRIKIDSFEGSAQDLTAGFSAEQAEQLMSNLYVEAQLMEGGVPMGLPSRTIYSPHGGDSAAGGGHGMHAVLCRWNDVLTFSHVRYWHLSRNAEMHLTLHALCAPRKLVTLGRGSFRLFSNKGRLKSGRKKVGLELFSKTASEGESKESSPALETGGETGEGAFGAGGGWSMEKLDKLMQRYDSNAMPRCAWLDLLAMRRIEQLNQAHVHAGGQPPRCAVIMVEMERWDRCVLYGVKSYSVVPATATWCVADAEVCSESPVELKHRKLSRSLHRTLVDRNLQPDSQERRHIQGLLKAPWDWADLTGVKMNQEDKELLWRYRYALFKENKALTKLLICVDWSDEHEVEQAVELLAEWEKRSSIDIDDALQLLSGHFTHPKVRMAAAARIAIADDKELLGYLLQLVQALRYEPVAHHNADSLLNLLVHRASENIEIANFLHWYIFCQQLVEADLKDVKGRARCYERAQRRLIKTLELTEKGRAMMSMLEHQHDLVTFLTKLAHDIKKTRDTRQKKMERLKTALTSTNSIFFAGPSSANGIVLNINPLITATGLLAEDAEVFKSAQMPLGISFATNIAQGQSHIGVADRLVMKYRIIFKHGDDLRQDQLVLQMLRLMDTELKMSGLDLKLTPYRVIATSPTTGMVERVEGYPLSKVLSEYSRDIKSFFRQYHADRTGPFGVKAQVMDNYVKSCAGYCVVTYLLGVGDRHLENVLLSPNGYLIHIDFGFILGRDPKPLPPAFKLVKEMVDAMGGQQSAHYRQFQQYCCEAYMILRRRATLLMNLMMLMKDASIADISGVPGRPEDPERQLYKFWERFHLEMSNEEAYAHMQSLIIQCQTAFVPQMVEWAHKLKQDWTA